MTLENFHIKIGRYCIFRCFRVVSGKHTWEQRTVKHERNNGTSVDWAVYAKVCLSFSRSRNVFMCISDCVCVVCVCVCVLMYVSVLVGDSERKIWTQPMCETNRNRKMCLPTVPESVLLLIQSTEEVRDDPALWNKRFHITTTCWSVIHVNNKQSRKGREKGGLELIWKGGGGNNASQHPMLLSGLAKYNPDRVIAPRLTNAVLRKYLKGTAGVGQKCWHSKITLSDNICRVAHSQPVFSIQPWQRVGSISLHPLPCSPRSRNMLFFFQNQSLNEV